MGYDITDMGEIDLLFGAIKDFDRLEQRIRQVIEEE